MAKTYKGYELIKEITEGKINNCKLKYNAPFFTKGELEVINKRLLWKQGTFSTAYLTDNITEFEIIEEQQDIDIQKIEEINDNNCNIEVMTADEVDEYNHSTRRLINQLVQAVKQLDKNIKDKE